jgi:hypothetical protein
VVGGIKVFGQPGQSYLETLSEKQIPSKRAGDLAQVVEYLPSKQEALTLIPIEGKKKKEC